jgi:hypothetical protein
VAANSKRVEIKLDADRRFAAAAAGGARYLGEFAGLNADAAQKFQAATLFACEETFAQLDARHRRVEITLAHFVDRIEVSITHHAGPSPSVGLDQLINSARNPIAGVDRVQYEQQPTANITRLTKYLNRHS